MADIGGYDLTRHLQLLDSGKFSDFEVICGDHTIKCHRAILCTQSEYFQKLADGNFESNGKATFPDDNPAVIARMLVFLYTGRYMPKLISPGLAITQFETISDPYATESQPNQLHVAMYALGDKICNEKLRNAAKNHFYENCLDNIWSGIMSEEDFANVVETVYATTPESDRGLRDIVVNRVLMWLAWDIASDQAVFRKTLKQVPDFAFDVAVHRLSTKTYECKNCGATQMLLVRSCSHNLFSENCGKADCFIAWLSNHWCQDCGNECEFGPDRG